MGGEGEAPKCIGPSFIPLPPGHARVRAALGWRARNGSAFANTAAFQTDVCTHTHARAHARLHGGQKQANNEPSFSDVEPIRSGRPSAGGGMVPRHCGHFLTPAAAHKHF